MATKKVLKKDVEVEKAPVETGSEAPAEAKPSKVAGPAKLKAVKVEDHEGNFAIVDPATRRYVRSYSADIHGDDYRDLVTSLLEGHPNFIAVDEEDIKKVRVSFYVMSKATGINQLVTEDYTDLDAALARSAEVKDASIEVL